MKNFALRILDDLTDYYEMDDLERICSLRRWVYKNSMLASSAETLTPREPEFGSMSGDDFMTVFLEGYGGLWCHGAAHYLHRAYVEFGYEAYVFSYGMPESTTHTVTLVNSGGELYVQDAYFNCCFADRADVMLTMDSVMEHLGKREKVFLKKEETLLRPVLSPGMAWTNEIDHTADNWKRSHGKVPGWIGMFNTSLAVFERHFLHSAATKDQLESDELPRDFSYLLLYPLWLFDGVRMYGEDHGSGDLFRSIEKRSDEMKRKAAALGNAGENS